ncbi:type II toxin-antitoxin system RelE/ParE family toxin, partial [Turicimonas muris]
NYQPYRYPQYEIQIPGVSSLRKLVVGKYLVLYTVDDSKQLVSVFRVISSRRDIASLLDGELSESR